MAEPYGGQPPREDTPGSIAAAENIKPHRKTQRERVLEVINLYTRGISYDYLQRRLDINPNSLNPRLRELILAGNIGVVLNTEGDEHTIEGKRCYKPAGWLTYEEALHLKQLQKPKGSAQSRDQIRRELIWELLSRASLASNYHSVVYEWLHQAAKDLEIEVNEL